MLIHLPNQSPTPPTTTTDEIPCLSYNPFTLYSKGVILSSITRARFNGNIRARQMLRKHPKR